MGCLCRVCYDCDDCLCGCCSSSTLCRLTLLTYCGTNDCWISQTLNCQNPVFYLKIARRHELKEQPQWQLLLKETGWFFQNCDWNTSGSSRALIARVDTDTFYPKFKNHRSCCIDECQQNEVQEHSIANWCMINKHSKDSFCRYFHVKCNCSEYTKEDSWCSRAWYLQHSLQIGWGSKIGYSMVTLDAWLWILVSICMLLSYGTALKWVRLARLEEKISVFWSVGQPSKAWWCRHCQDESARGELTSSGNSGWFTYCQASSLFLKRFWSAFGNRRVCSPAAAAFSYTPGTRPMRTA